MNRSRGQYPERTKKLLNKEIRRNQASPLRAQPSLVDPEELLKRYPKRRAKIFKSHLLSMQKTMRIKGAPKKKLSKRTSPSEFIEDSTPQYARTEGAAWVKTLDKQTRANRVVGTRKAAKNLRK